MMVMYEVPAIIVSVAILLFAIAFLIRAIGMEIRDAKRARSLDRMVEGLPSVLRQYLHTSATRGKPNLHNVA